MLFFNNNNNYNNIEINANTKDSVLADLRLKKL